VWGKDKMVRRKLVEEGGGSFFLAGGRS